MGANGTNFSFNFRGRASLDASACRLSPHAGQGTLGSGLPHYPGSFLEIIFFHSNKHGDGFAIGSQDKVLFLCQFSD